MSLSNYHDPARLADDFREAMEQDEPDFRRSVIDVFRQPAGKIPQIVEQSSTQRIGDARIQMNPWASKVKFNGGWYSPQEVARRIKELS